MVSASGPVSVSATQTFFFPSLLLVMVFIMATKRQTKTTVIHHHCQSLPGRAFLQVKRLYPDIAFSWGAEGLGVPLLDILRRQTFLFKNKQERERSVRGVRQITGGQLPFLFIKMQLRRLYSEKLSSVNQMARLQNTTGIKCKWSPFSLWPKPEGTDNPKRGERVKFHPLIRKRRKRLQRTNCSELSCPRCCFHTHPSVGPMLNIKEMGNCQKMKRSDSTLDQDTQGSDFSRD